LKLRERLGKSQIVALVNVHSRHNGQTLALVGVCVNRIGRVCSLYYDETMYCGLALRLRAEKAVDAERDADCQKLRGSGYTQEQIANWPPPVLDAARNIVGNGCDKATLDKWINEQASKW
ncbi:MAG: hypothetical protein ABR878_07210, partial [Roseiarcus sp.]